jgi:molybdopterin-guanine dinucleotide biosynthesis protein A
MTLPRPIDPAQITGIVLAGGRNSRMGGQHKALLQWHRQSFIEHIVERLRDQVGRIVINSNRPELFATQQLPIVADPFAEQRGPLAGVLAGLRHSATPLALFVPCDNPRICTQLAPRLATALHAAGADIAYAATAGDDHYLYALMHTRLADSVERYLQDGASAVRLWYARQRCCRVDFADQADSFININSAADLALLD